MEKRIDDLSAFLFPCTHASEEEAKRILSFFDTLTIFQPWHIDRPFSFPVEPRRIRVLRPPEHLRPIEGFQSLVSEYKSWMRQHPDKGYASALSAMGGYGKSEDSTWSIRRSIRRPEYGKNPAGSSATQWHLVLHLAQETQDTLREACEALAVLKKKGSPLRGAMGDEEGVPGPLDDLSEFEVEREMDEEFVERLLEAWNGLFGEFVDENAALVTLSRDVFEKLSDLWSEYRSEEWTPRESLRICWPYLSRENAEEFRLKGSEVEGQARLKELRDAIKRIQADPAGQTRLVGELTERLESAPPPDGPEMIHFQFRFFAPGSRATSRKKSLNVLSGKLFFLLEESCGG